MSYSAMRRKRFTAGVLAGAMALTVMPILGFTGTAGALEPATGDGSVCEDPPEAEPFTDVSDEDPSQAEIECLVNAGITTGVTATTYEPNAPVTRRQMAVFLTRLADTAEENEIGDEVTELPAGDGETPFTDIADEEEIFQDAIDRLEDAGIAEGVTTTTFVPEAFVTRRQMAKFIVRLQDFLAGDQDITPNDPDDAFTDDEGDTGEDELNILAEEGIFLGDGAGNVNPGDDISRRQMANVIIRKAQYLFEEGLIDRLFEEDDVPATATVRPELQTAQILQTVTALQGTPAQPAGTYVRYTFDENVLNPNNALFFVYNSSDPSNPIGATAASVADGNTVIGYFAGLTTPASAADLTVAAVDDGAVNDVDAFTNPEGDAAIGSAATTPVGTSGVTAAPDVQTVAAFRTGAVADTTAVDITFDEAAIVVNEIGWFEMITRGGQYLDCDAQDDTTVPSGGTVPGGSGTATLTILCDNIPAVAPATATTPLTAANTARVVVWDGAVRDNDTVPNTNVDQAADAGNSGNTLEFPNLVSATLQPNANAAMPDHVLYVFDRPVQLAGAGNLYVYDGSGNYTGGATSATVNPASPTQVRAEFAPGTGVDVAVGAISYDGAVASAGDITAQNLFDEVGVANAAATTRTPGVTVGPDLVSVTLAQSTDGFGNPGPWTATYTFDEDISAAGAPLGGALAPNDFVVYAADGTRRLCQGPLSFAPAGTAAGSNNTVSCSVYAPASLDPAVANQQVGASVLGIVEHGAVEDGDGNDNPIGAAVTTGGTGTPAS